MARRLAALQAAGVNVFLICWAEDAKSARANLAASGLFSDFLVLPYVRGLGDRLRQGFLNFTRPSPVGTRTVSAATLCAIEARIRDFRPSVVINDGLMAGDLSLRLANLLRVPYWVRSHNIEYLYWRKQFKRVGSIFGRIRLLGRLIGLESFERKLLRAADLYFDISVDDLKFWRSQGFSHGIWLPPLIDAGQNPVIPSTFESERFDVGFVGNLRMPNNVEGLIWLITNVKPRLDDLLQRPSRFLIAGSSPVAAVVELCAGREDMELHANFASLQAELSSCKVLANPMLAGSGVALKTIDMLLSGLPVVSTSQGCAGLPVEVRLGCEASDDAQSFAVALYGALTGVQAEQGEPVHSVVRRLFGGGSLSALIDRIPDV